MTTDAPDGPYDLSAKARARSLSADTSSSLARAMSQLRHLLYMDGNLVLELKSKAESELRSGMESLKPEEAAVLALLRSRLAKEAEGTRGQRARAA
jgi:hypothetical protein